MAGSRTPPSVHEQCARLLAQRREGRIDRRKFLGCMAALIGAAATPGQVLAAAGAGAIPAPTWRTVAAAQEHMFPAGEDSPGAADINATAYLQAVLLDPLVDEDEKDFIEAGARWLVSYVARQHGAELADLDAERREQILRRMHDTPDGRDWLALVLYYMLEALLGDPVYGGNPDGIGWTWLEHQPGFPRPPAGKRYFELS